MSLGETIELGDYLLRRHTGFFEQDVGKGCGDGFTVTKFDPLYIAKPPFRGQKYGPLHSTLLLVQETVDLLVPVDGVRWEGTGNVIST